MKIESMIQASVNRWTINKINSKFNHTTHPVDMRNAVNKISSLPPLPGNAQNILKLASDPQADTQKLAEIVEKDPILTTQIIRWASSSVYGYRGKITTVNEAISRVLGFNFVLNLVLGLAAIAPLKSPKEGLIGTKMFMKHAIASTRLMKMLNEQLSADQRLEPQQVFLAAMIHNIGFPLLGHEFPEEFKFLDKLIMANPNLPIFNIESFAFGVEHTLLGAWLMNHWSMPKPVIDVVYHHHNPFYRGDNHQLSLLTYLNDCLLSDFGIGDAMNQEYPAEVLEQLQLTESVCQELKANLQEELNEISQLAESLIS